MLGKQSKLAKTVLVFFGLLLNSTLISANDNICNTAFDELVLEGLSSHPSIEVSKKIVIGADLQLSSAKWGYYPTPSIDVAKSLSKTRITLRLDQPLWDGGKINAVRDKAQARKTEATYIYAESQYKLIEDYLNTLQKYLQAQDKISIMNSGIDQLKSLMQTIDRMIVAGELSIADKNLLSTKIADIYSSLEITRAEFDVAKIQFEILTGHNLECDISFNEKPILDIWFNVGYFIFSSDKFKYFKKFKRFKKLLEFMAKKKLMKTYKHRGKHITVNTLEELEKAKQQIKKFN